MRLFALMMLAASLSASAYAGTRWAYQVSKNYYEEADCVRKTTDGGYIVAGWTAYDEDAEVKDAWLMKLDQGGNVTWQKTYGGKGYNDAAWVEQTSDGGYIMAGATASYRAGYLDAWIVKTDSLGRILWQKAYAGTFYSWANSVQQTSDGGYVFAGASRYFGARLPDYWCVKLDATGRVVWQRALGGVGWDEAHYVRQTPDGGYIIVGQSQLITEYGTGWCVRLDASGKVKWQKAYYDPSRNGNLFGACQTPDGGFMLVGVSIGTPGLQDAWCLRVDASGEVMWQKTYGGGGPDWASWIEPAPDGGYVLVGQNSSVSPYSRYGGWFLMLDSAGRVVQQRVYRALRWSVKTFFCAVHAPDGGYVIVGRDIVNHGILMKVSPRGYLCKAIDSGLGAHQLRTNATAISPRITNTVTIAKAASTTATAVSSNFVFDDPCGFQDSVTGLKSADTRHEIPAHIRRTGGLPGTLFWREEPR